MGEARLDVLGVCGEGLQLPQREGPLRATGLKRNGSVDSPVGEHVGNCSHLGYIVTEMP